MFRTVGVNFFSRDASPLEEGDFASMMERLRFCCSARIALAVTGMLHPEDIDHPDWTDSLGFTRRLIIALFSAMQHFIANILTNLCLPPMQAAQHIVEPGYTPGTQRVQFDHQVVEQLALLCGNVTRLDLSWPWTATAAAFVRMLCRRTGPLPNLKKLWIRPRSNQAVIVEALLRLCPALEGLLRLPLYALPLLKFYEGPAERREHQRLHARGARLGGIEERAKIVSLELRLHALNDDFLKSEYGEFGNSEKIYSVLCRAAPELQTLELLTIRVENELQLLDPRRRRPGL
ncbi:hypothetical protein C8J57DRAFT_1491922 [Mycena rebaudengoi]|nr:hypothetical protein C8J57DRAFT_1491922 [Mycena rebaudengoi]